MLFISISYMFWSVLDMSKIKKFFQTVSILFVDFGQFGEAV